MFTLFSLFIICSMFKNAAKAQDDYILSNVLGSRSIPMQIYGDDAYLMGSKYNFLQPDTVNVKVYYECLCPDCIKLDFTQFRNVIERLMPYISVQTYPYGNAKTIEQNGRVEFECQHGPKECYGNKLHACALNLISNNTVALFFNICMMDPKDGSRGSDDTAAVKCGNFFGINVRPILQCAKGELGTQLLKYYGNESKKVNFNYVPYVLINGKEWKGEDLLKDVCAAFINPPAACRDL